MTRPGSDTTRRRVVRTGLVLFAVSAVVRLALAGAVAAAGSPRLFDEGDYLRRAQAFAQILRQWAGLRGADPGDWTTVYDGGTWPPLHPLALGVALFVAGHGLVTARLAMALVSALTTPLVYLVGRRFASHRAGVAAAGLHLVSPSFLAFSHYLWSETTYVFLLFVALLVADALARGSGPARAASACALGGLLGALTLTRAAGLPYVALAPFWVAWVLWGREGAVRSAVLTALCSVLAVAPWELAVLRQEGHLAPLVTSGGENLLLGNNPWVPPGLGSSWGDPESQALALGAAKKRASAESLPSDIAARRIAVETMRDDPRATLRRAAERARILASPDAFLLRYLLRAAYPPLPAWLVASLVALAIVVQVAVVALAALGFLARPPLGRRGLLLASLVLGALPSLTTVAVSRMALPLFALALPAAGRGWTALRERGPRWRLAVAALVSVPFAYAAVATLPLVLRHHALPSSYYAPLLDRVARTFGTRIGTTDVIALRVADPEGAGQIELRLSEGYRFLTIDGDRLVPVRPDGARRRKQVWEPAGGRGVFVVEAFARGECPPLAIEIDAPDLGGSATVRPVQPALWRSFGPSGIPGLEVQWMGGGSKVPSE